MMGWMKCYAVALAVFFSVDAVWLGLIGGPMYVAAIGPLLADEFRILPAVLFYLMHIAGILVLVLPRAQGELRAAATYGAMFGLCTYGTYDLTNHAVLKLWSWELTLIDMAWGAFITGLAATAGAWIQRRG